jgi:multiple sugar transport system ATP-binding protein
LSNLDAALRLRTRVELAQLEAAVDAAVIMVTHDQAEAMTLADRIVVMNDRRIQQVGPPMEIYSRPANVFVAQFVGSPAMTLRRRAGRRAGEFATVKLGDGSEVETKVPREGLPAEGGAALGLRPEAVRVVGAAARDDHQSQGRAGRAARRADPGLRAARRRAGDHRRGRGHSRVRIGDEVG